MQVRQRCHQQRGNPGGRHGAVAFVEPWRAWLDPRVLLGGPDWALPLQLSQIDLQPSEPAHVVMAVVDQSLAA